MATKINKKVVVSGMLGNGLEWYDYALYGILASIFAEIFFPPGDPTTKLIMSYLTFAVGFIFRPLGAVIFGRIGDKYGRKKALVTSMMLMAVATGCLGLLPTYEMIGIAAPIMLVLIRIIQGISLGGAFSGSMSYVVEHAPANRRGAMGSVTMLSLVIGFLMGSIVATVTAALMSAEDFMSWGWRIPFFFGVAIGFVGHYIRNHGEESPEYEKAKESGGLSDRPVREAFLNSPWLMIRGFNVYIFVTIPFYLLAIYMIGYTERHIGLSKHDALQVNSIAMIGMFLPIWFIGNLSDRIGRKKVLLWTIFAMIIAVYPAFHIMQQGTFMAAAMGQFILAFILGCYLAPIPAMLVELFPTRIRYTGMSLSYNICAIVGGLTPSLSEWLIRSTGDKESIMYIILAAAVLSFGAMLSYKDRYKEPLS